MTDLVTVAVPALPQAGPISGNELVPIHQNGRMVKIRQGDLTAGGAAFLDSVAAIAIVAGTVVVGLGGQMWPADPLNADHCGAVLGLLTADTAKGVTGRVQSLGPMTGLALPDASDTNVLVIGLNGVLARALPEGAKWQQAVGRSDGARVVVTLGEASLIVEGDAMVGDGGGFAARATATQIAALSPDGYLTPADVLAVIERVLANVPDQSVAAPGRLCRSGDFLSIKGS